MNAEQLLKNYSDNLREFSGIDLRGTNFQGATLSNVNFSWANLTQANFSVAKLSGTSLSRAICHQTNFHGAVLTLADLSHADLDHADLRHADLTRSDLNTANLQFSDLSHADLRDAQLRCANFSRATLHRTDLRHAKLIAANLAHANLANSEFSNANLAGADLRNAELRQANLSRANLQGANLAGANLRWADLSGANLQWADLSDAKLSGANLTGADLSHATMLNTTLVHADLTRANLALVDWAGSDLSGSTLTGIKLNGVSQFGIKTSGANCRWLDLSTHGDQTQIFQFLTDYPDEYFHETAPIVQLVVDAHLSNDSFCALAVAYQQMARRGGMVTPPHVEVRRQRTILRFELEQDEQLFFSAYIAALPFADGIFAQTSILNLAKLVSSQALRDPARLKQFQASVTKLSQSIHQIDTGKLLQSIPTAIQKVRFFQAPTRVMLLNSNNQVLTVYDNPKFGKGRIKAATSEEELEFLNYPPVFRPPTEQEAIDFIAGFHP
jgi:uncharacterized protein YjbI with pentapeptide repeats